MAYSEKVVDHYENPRNVGSFDKNDSSVGTGLVGAPSCGDVLKLQIKVVDGIITDAVFKAYGCFISNALINTPTRSRKISELRIGDAVLAWNGTTVVSQKIKEIIKHSVPVSELMCVSIARKEGSTTTPVQLIVTKDHIFWGANNKPVQANTLCPGQELYELTEHELRVLTNIRHRDELKQKNSKRMFEFNKGFDKTTLPQNQPGYVCKDVETARKRKSIAAINKWSDPAYKEKWSAGMSAIDRAKPTSIENKFIKLFEENNVAAVYSANKVWIQTSSGPASPDFIVPGKKKCIEVYTTRMPAFMQDRSTKSDYVKNRVAQFASAGYDCLCIPIEQFSEALPTVQNFIHNGKKIIKVSSKIHGHTLNSCERDGDNVIVYDLRLEDGAHVYFSHGVGSHNCGSAIASSSLVTEWVKGKSLDDAVMIKNQDIAEELCLPPVKIHCSILAEDSIKAAIADYKAKHVVTH
jgi:NifU-like protein involved in Fe-S cluster formation